jgi:hypothetical protein
MLKPATILIVLAAMIALCASRGSGTDGLDELNAKRARQGLYPFQRDEALTQAAEACAAYRAARRIAGHAPNDFAFLPPGTFADGAGCAAAEDSWGWLSCYMDDRRHAYAGAAWTRGSDGQRYMHLFVANRPNALRQIARVAARPIQAIQARRETTAARAPEYAPHDPRGYPDAVAIFTAESGWCRACNALKAAGLRERLRHTTLIVFDIDKPLPAGVRREQIQAVPRILVYRQGVRTGDWTGYSPQIDREVMQATTQGTGENPSPPTTPDVGVLPAPPIPERKDR